MKKQKFELSCGSFLIKRNPSKNRRMPVRAACTRYSLVKGERIVRSVLTARLRAFEEATRYHFIPQNRVPISDLADVGI